MSKPDNGKGDCPRPLSIPGNKFRIKWDMIFRKESDDKSKK